MTEGTNHHLLHVIGDFGEGGDGRQALSSDVALRAHGVSSRCVALKPGGAVAARQQGVRAHEVQSGAAAFGALQGAIRFRALIGRLRPTVVHVHGPRSLLLVVTALAGCRRPPRIWFTWHDSGQVLPRGKLSSLLLRRCLDRCEFLFGSSESVCERLRAALPHRRDIAVFRNGVPSAVGSRGVSRVPPTLVWSARFVPPKNPSILIRAASALRQEGLAFKVVMAGDSPPHLGWLRDEVQTLIADLGLRDIVSTPGWLADLSQTYRRAAIGVQTSTTEGLSLALLEQMMAGLAVVATDVGDTAFALADGIAGTLVPPGELPPLVSALRSLISDVDLRVQLGTVARERAQAHFSLEAIAEQYLRRL